MARRKNTLNKSELSIVHQETQTYVESINEAIELFEKDCDLRDLRPYTIKFYRKELSAFLSQQAEQGIDLVSLIIVKCNLIRLNIRYFFK